ncbi:hypothetical protein P43SY_000285 [Pythium insidiosum]|uniref:Aspartyl/asparaginy/proline hydroxylase domain-containing protein n=1 Tax=Pythium insidiosum TaxID=114742 RepID=A0AAD5Q6A9_PYTIN|nr:hypothetical protein P43SY_000285 [Pythium insidiosum]
MRREEEAMESKLRDVVRTWGLSRFSEEMAWQWIRKSFADELASDGRYRSVHGWLRQQLNGQRSQREHSPWQRGCPELLPSLRATAVWSSDAFAWIRRLEDAYPAIKSELLALKGQRGFQPYRAPSWASSINSSDGLGSLGHDAGDWNVFYLFLHNVDFAQNRALCPQTVALIESIPEQYEHAFFSALAPGTHIKKHHGPTNKKLRCHLPLVVPNGRCRLRVGDEVITVEEGKCFVFDDSFEHEAWNDDPTHARIVLIIDVWHPDLSPAECKFLSFLRNAQLRMDKKLASTSKDNFFSIIHDANQANMSLEEAIWS